MAWKGKTQDHFGRESCFSVGLRDSQTLHDDYQKLLKEANEADKLQKKKLKRPPPKQRKSLEQRKERGSACATPSPTTHLKKSVLVATKSTGKGDGNHDRPFKRTRTTSGGTTSSSSSSSLSSSLPAVSLSQSSSSTDGRRYQPYRSARILKNAVSMAQGVEGSQAANADAAAAMAMAMAKAKKADDARKTAQGDAQPEKGLAAEESTDEAHAEADATAEAGIGLDETQTRAAEDGGSVVADECFFADDFDDTLLEDPLPCFFLRCEKNKIWLDRSHLFSRINHDIVVEVT